MARTQVRTEVEQLLERLYVEVVDATEEADRESLIRLWRELGVAVAEFRELARQAEAAAVELIDRGERVIIDGFDGPVERASSTTRESWDARAAALDYVRARMDAGAIGHPNDAVDAVLEVASVSRCRVGKLKEAGLDPADYREVEYGAPRLRLS
jgi:hypothetical protein